MILWDQKALRSLVVQKNFCHQVCHPVYLDFSLNILLTEWKSITPRTKSAATKSEYTESACQWSYYALAIQVRKSAISDITKSIRKCTMCGFLEGKTAIKLRGNDMITRKPLPINSKSWEFLKNDYAKEMSKHGATVSHIQVYFILLLIASRQ